MPLLLSIILPTTLAIAIGAVLVYRILLHPLAQFPGPPEARLSGLWRDTRIWRGSWHEDVLALHKQYGPAVRIAPNELSLVDAKALRQLYNHGTKASKTEWYAEWQADPQVPATFSTLDKKLHAFLRKRTTAAYSMSATLNTYEGYIQEVLDSFMAKMREFAGASQTVDLARWVDHLGYDLISTLGYGEPLGMLETDSDVMDVQKNIQTSFYLVNGMAYWWGGTSWINGPLVKKLSQWLRIPNPLAGFQQWSQKQVQTRVAQMGSVVRPDLLSHFLQMKSADGSPASMDEILVEMVNGIGAGADTTSITMRACVLFLLLNPEIYHQVQDEVDAYYKDHALQQPMTYLQTLKLPLFCATVRETSRMFPAITAQLPRYAPEGMVVGGKKIPQGTCVSMSAVAANRDPLVFGDDADLFRPSRWLGDEEKVQYFNTHDLTWGGTGPRTCLGKNIALVDIHKFLAQFLHHFDVELTNAEKPWKVTSQFFAHTTDMYVRLRYRGGLAGNEHYSR